MSKSIDDGQAGSVTHISLATVVIPPLVVILFLATALFAPLLGTQATEIARVVLEAEADLKYLISGEARGDFLQLVSKLIIFDALLLIWTFTTASLTYDVASRRLPGFASAVLAALVAVSMPAILFVKYWSISLPTQFWLELFGIRIEEPLRFPEKLLQFVPAFEPGGIWVFFFVVAIQVCVVLWFTFKVFPGKNRSVGQSRLAGPIFWASVLAFCATAVLVRLYPHEVTSVLGTTNTVALYSLLLYGSLAGLTYYLHFGTARTVAFVFLIYLVAVQFMSPYLAQRDGQQMNRAGTSLNSEDSFVRWYKNRAVRAVTNSETPVFIVAAAGGGMRATLRTAFFLEHMRRTCPKFFHHTFAISSVSGGALGALLAVANSQIEPNRPAENIACDMQKPSGKLQAGANLLDHFLAVDILPSIVGAGLFGDLFGLVAPPGVLPYFDRSIAVRKTLARSWADAVKAAGISSGATPTGTNCGLKDYLSNCDSNSYWSPKGDVPLLVFNTTSAVDGGIVPLSNIDPQYFSRLPLGSLSRYRGRLREMPAFELISGALTSARFPLTLPAAHFRDKDGRSHFLVDGGYFDNSGLIVAKAIKDHIEVIVNNNNSRPQAEPINAKVYIIYLNETDQNRNVCELIGRLAPGEFNATNGEFAHIMALFTVRDRRSVLNESFVRSQFADEQSLIDFAWDLYTPAVIKNENQDDCGSPRQDLPLAFYYSSTTRHQFNIFLETSLLYENTEMLAKLQSLMTQN